MNKKQLLFGEESRKKLVNGVEQISKAVKTTLGPKGRLVMLDKEYGGPTITKDGVSVAKEIVLEDPFENMGAQVLKEVASKTNDVAGDGPQPLYAKVLTPNGFVEIGTLKAGDEICGISGNVQKVVNTFDKGMKDLYRVCFNRDSDFVECSNDHLWTVYEGKNGKCSTLTTAKLIEEMNNGKTFYTPNTKSFFNEKNVSIDPFTLGVIIGDGSFTKSMDTVEICIGKKKKSKIIPNLKLPDGIETHISENPEKNAYRIKLVGRTNEGKTMVDFLKDLNLYGCNSADKFIPKDYLINSIKNREELLKGLSCTDGYINKRGLLEYSTISNQLKNDIKFLMKSLGYSVYTYSPKRKGGYSDTEVYRIYQLKGYKYGQKITSIKKSDHQEHMMCIKVSNKDELYITDNFIATHNTTTATVLAYAMVKEGMKAVAYGCAPIELKRGMDKALEYALKEIEKIAKPVSTDEVINVASISANNDRELGKILADAFEKVGKDGVITVEESRTMETTTDFVEGMQFDSGYISPNFVTDKERMTCDYDNPYILLYNGRLSAAQPMLPLLEKIAQAGAPLIILCDDLDGEAMATLAINTMRGALKVCAVKAPGIGQARSDMMEDISILTNGKIVNVELGDKLENLELEDLGRAKSIKITKSSTTIVSGDEKSEALDERIKEIEGRIENAESESEKLTLKKRLAKLTGGVAVIKVGASTELEMKEKKLRVEDTLAATRAALEEGIVPGGGKTLIEVLTALEKVDLEAEGFTDGEIVGFNIIKNSLKEPIKQIAENAGENGDIIVEEAKKAKKGFGFDAYALEWKNLVEAGIIDPAKVTKTALKNAVSVVGLLLTTECIITDKEEENVINLDQRTTPMY